MEEKIKLIDTTKCIGCRGCQVACKQWNQLPAGSTKNTGTYQNPPDLQAHTWTLIRYQEVSENDGQVEWLFRKDGCMHCTDATCEKLCPAGARVRLDYGAVARNDEKCIGCQACVVACPFGKPRYSEEEGKVFKCGLCPDRVQNNLDPACVKACPTGALRFGKKEEMLKIAYDRVKELGGEASVYGEKFFRGTHVLYVLGKDVNLYKALPAKPKVGALIFWKELLKPFGVIKAGVGLTGLAASSFLTPRRRLIAAQHPKDKG